jgi:hypothetical protein
MTARMKAEQWLHVCPAMPVLFYDAWRVGDVIPDGPIPRGARNTKVYKHQQRNARLLLANRRRIHRDEGDIDDPPPTLQDCAASREVRPIYKNIIRYCVGHAEVHKHDITTRGGRFGLDLLSRCAATFARMNIHLNPSFHYCLHIEPFLHKYGSIYNTWCFPFERANKVLVNTNNNGHGLGTLETTMIRGFLKKTECIRVVSICVYVFLLSNI